MARKQTEALKVAKSWVGRTYPHGWCQKWVVTEVFASGGVGDWDGDKAADAEDGWKAAKKKVATSDPRAVPAGLPIYFIGGSGDFGHAAVSAGDGNMYSTDYPRQGQIGLTPIKSVERPWGVKFVGYVTTDGNGNNLLDSAPAPTPTPPPSAFVLAKSAVQNVAGYNAPGQPGVRKFKTFIPRIAGHVIASKVDVFNVQELSNKVRNRQRPLLDSKLKGFSRAPGGSDGRYAYTASTVKRFASGKFTAAKSTWYRNDDKQAAWVAYTKDGARALDVSFHLESDNGRIPDAKRVEQALSILKQTIAKAKALKIPLENVLLTGDTNSVGMVAAAMKKAGWPAIANEVATFRGWDRKSHQRFDYGFVLKGVKASLKVVKSYDSDHERLLITRQLVK